MNVQFAQSVFVPIAIGFFGLGTGYFIWGGQALFGFPRATPEVNKSIGMWGFWMPGFMQFITGVYLMVGMTWFGVFVKSAPLYMAALAFTAYGIHWFAMSHRRYIGSSADADGWMAIAFLILSILGVVIFIMDNDIPVAIVFIGLSLIYLSEIPSRFLKSAIAARFVGLWQVLTGIWLMYMTVAVALTLSVPNMHLWI